MKKKVEMWVASLSILYFIFVALSFIDFGFSKVVITNIGENSIFSNGTSVHVSYVAINSIEQKAESYAVDLDKEEDEYGVSLKNGDSIELKIPLFSRCEVKFLRTDESGYVEIQDCNRTRLINLAGENSQSVIVHPSVTTKVQWALLVLFSLILYFIIVMLFTILKQKRPFLYKSFFKRDFLWILLTAISTRIYYWHYFAVPHVVWPDTYTYDLFFQYRYTDIRTPGYPILFLIPRIFADNNEEVYLFVVFAQILMGLFSIYIFWRIVNDILPSNLGRNILTLIYANIPMLIFYEHYLMSDSMSVFLLLICIRLVQKFLIKPTGKMVLAIALSTTACILERPGSIYLIPLLLVFFVLYVINGEGRKIAISTFWMLIPIVILLLYCLYNYCSVGKFEISCVPVLYNEGFEVMDISAYDGTEFKDIEDRVTEYKMEYGNNQWNYLDIIIEEYGNDYVNFIKKASHVNSNELTIDRMHKITDSLFQSIISNQIPFSWMSYNPMAYFISDDGVMSEKIFNILLCPFTYGIIIIFVIITLIFSFYQWMIRKHILWLDIGISGILFCTVFASIWNAYNDYQRLTITIIPVIYILISLWIKKLNIKVEG